MSYAAAGPSRPYVMPNGPGPASMAMPVPYRNGSSSSSSGLPALPPDLPPKTDYSAPSPRFATSPSSGDPRDVLSPTNSMETGGSGPSEGEAGSKRNPLVDLMDSEKVYVEHLGLVIRVRFPCTNRLA